MFSPHFILLNQILAGTCQLNLMQEFVNEFQVLIWIANPLKDTVMEKVEIQI